MTRKAKLVRALAFGALLLPPSGVTAASAKAETVDAILEGLTHPYGTVRHEALTKLVTLGDRSAIPALIELLRFDAGHEVPVGAALESLSGQKFGSDWKKWLEWQATQTDLRPSPGYLKWKSQLFSLIDPAFAEFLHPGVKHRVRIEEIVWGGVVKDGIPALTNPRHIRPSEATYLTPDELVLGLSIRGQHRAYPLRIMDWHEMANDVVGGTPVTISY